MVTPAIAIIPKDPVSAQSGATMASMIYPSGTIKATGTKTTGLAAAAILSLTHKLAKAGLFAFFLE
jgi:hypothetical protein